ncbi:MAG: hypothetical protein FJ288_15275 [Planctomycetes bacterium]|nr:hypothetical protein [Planctomycetota bacterium]
MGQSQPEARDEAADNVAGAAAAGSRPRFSLAALLGLLGFVPVFGMCLLAGFLARSVFPLVPVFPGWPEVLVTVGFGLAGVLWTMACGIVGIVQILRSDGRLTGLWLANIEAVIWPAVALGLAFATVLACV